MKNPYDYFSRFVLRTPLLSIDFYKDITSGEIISRETLKEAYCNPLVRESCFLASPTLYFELEKLLDDLTDPKKEKRLLFSLLKYLTRMSTRCTPFGLFAGCTLGNITTDKTKIVNTLPEHNKRHTRLDMNYLVALSQDLSKKKSIQEKLLYYPNTSIYTSGSKIRYIEYCYVESRRQHNIVEVDNSIYLERVLKYAKSGAYLIDLVQLLVKEKVSKQESEGFVHELLDSQLLVSELEPSVSGPEFMTQILNVLEHISGTENEINFLNQIKKRLNKFDSQLGNNPKLYLDLSELLKKNETSFDLKYLFQVDLELRPIENSLSEDLLRRIKEGVLLLNRITPPSSETKLTKFKDSFYERYESREMPLSKVLDVETGIGYLQNTTSDDVNPLIDNILLPKKESPYKEYTIDNNVVLEIIERKLIECEKTGAQKIVLVDNDFEDLPLNWEDLPDTMSAMVEVVRNEETEKIKFSGIGGSSAANLLGRYCHSDDDLKNFAKSVVDLEKKMKSDKILAEIVHLPEARVGNILMRPGFRNYEIPYLAKSNLPLSYQIPVDDLYLSVKNSRLFLRSKKLNKEIIPRLTNAHNFSSNGLPIYHFLCDMQNQNLRRGLFFNFDFLEKNRRFLPRVEYKNLILHQAKWKIRKIEIKSLLEKKEEVEALKKEVIIWRKKIRLPKYALLVDGDNELLINFENMTTVQMLLGLVKNRTKFVLSEFLFANEGIVRSDNGYYSHQILVSFFNKKRLNNKMSSIHE